MSTTNIPELKAFKIGFPIWILLMVLVAVGVVGFYLLSMEDATRAWFNYLIGSSLFLGLGLCGLFVILVTNLVKAKWVVSLRRVFECMAMTLPVAALLMVGVYLGREHLYEWTNLELMASDHLLHGKQGYLNAQFFLIRLIAAFSIWGLASFILLRNSFKQDASGDVRRTVVNYRLSSLFMILFALSVSWTGFDLMMSLEPHWFSTIYGVYFFAGFFQAGLALAYIVCWYLYTTGVLKDFINKTHFHDLGKFLFAFSVFWAYIGVSQFLLYWYGDLPEETFWYRVRMQDGWQWVGIAVVAMRWVIPFFVLMPYRHKTIFKISLPICFLVLAGHWLDLFWNAMPATRLMAHHAGAETAAVHHQFGSGVAWQEVAIALGFVSLFFLILGLVMQRVRMVPLKDPRLLDSINHH